MSSAHVTPQERTRRLFEQVAVKFADGTGCSPTSPLKRSDRRSRADEAARTHESLARTYRTAAYAPDERSSTHPARFVTVRRMSIVDKALWVIERNSSGELNLPAVAEACGVSRSHLANAFGSTTGWPVVKYLRARRLTRAAETLARGAPDILAVALDAGYGSHEAFTRAFRDQFGAPPERVRDRGSTEGLPLVAPLDLRVREQPVLAPPWVTEAAVRAVGMPGRHTFDTVIGIPIQWQTFMATRYDHIPNRVDGIPIGIQKPVDDEGGFDYLCAAEVTAFGDVPRDLLKIELPSRRYAVFEHRGHVSTLFDTYAAIWNEALEQHGWAPAPAPVIERHAPSFDPQTGEGGLSLWIPLAD